MFPALPLEEPWNQPECCEYEVSLPICLSLHTSNGHSTQLVTIRRGFMRHRPAQESVGWPHESQTRATSSATSSSIPSHRNCVSSTDAEINPRSNAFLPYLPKNNSLRVPGLLCPSCGFPRRHAAVPLDTWSVGKCGIGKTVLN